MDSGNQRHLDFSEINDELYIGTTPRSHDYALLRKLGVGLVINMRVERRPYPDQHKIPLPVLWLPVFDSPLVPIPIGVLVRGAKAAVDTIEQGQKVYIHCAQGMHRGVAMGSAILIARGHSARQAMDLVKQRRAVADPDIWYIRRRIERFEKQWKSLVTS